MPTDGANQPDITPSSPQPDISTADEKRGSDASFSHADHDSSSSSSGVENQHLGHLTGPQLAIKGEDYAREHMVKPNGETLEEDLRDFRIGAQAAAFIGFQGPVDELKTRCRAIPGIEESEVDALAGEITDKWSHPKQLYYVIAICSLCAAVQGMDETVVNGAQSFYKIYFDMAGTGSSGSWRLGLTNSAPYLCCAVLGCWLTAPLNSYFGRRGTLFLSCLFSAIACLAQGLVGNKWWMMFTARFFLGLGIGPKSATTPMFAAECAPPRIRGALVMQWQVWTAFGIMLGFVIDLSFYSIPDFLGMEGANWRMMLMSAGVPALLVCAVVPFMPESPGWYLTKGKPDKAFESMSKLRSTRIQAARDVFYCHVLLDHEARVMSQRRSAWIEMFTVRRNRNAMLASEITMLMQQFCGINVIAYYSSEIFIQAGQSHKAALGASLGFGAINFLFALPAFYTIDTFGRRNLLLLTFPLMSTCLFTTATAFGLPASNEVRVALIALGIYVFCMVYSPGAGPVPFTYSAEAYPLYIRAQGMSLATATTWFFNFLLAVTWPTLLSNLTPPGAFSLYGVYNVIGFYLVLFFMPETKGRTLEELDDVFDVPLKVRFDYGRKQAAWIFQHFIRRRDVPAPEQPQEKMMDGGDVFGEKNVGGVMTGAA